MLDLVGNPKDLFSHNEAQIIKMCIALSRDSDQPRHLVKLIILRVTTGLMLHHADREDSDTKADLSLRKAHVTWLVLLWGS